MHNKKAFCKTDYILPAKRFLFIVLMRISFDSVHSALLKQYPK